MRNYKKYMDGVEVSPELHERLSHLTPAKGPAPWKKYGALAAALVLVVGAGALGLSRLGATDAGPAAEIAEEEPDIAPVTDPAQLPSQQLQTNGGYEVTEGEVVSYFMLPAIVYNDAKDMMMADYSLAPPGSLSRTAGRSDVSALLDGADMTAHLLWDDELAWSGTVWLREEDSSPCAASLYAEGESVMFFVELMEGSAVPSCVVYPDASYKTTTFQGVEITALRSPGYAVKEDGRVLPAGPSWRDSICLPCHPMGRRSLTPAGNRASRTIRVARTLPPMTLGPIRIERTQKSPVPSLGQGIFL